jgi:hypothetical protein
MVENDARPKGFGAQWAVATPRQKLVSGAMIVLTLAIIVFVIIPLMKSAFVAGQHAVQ